MTTTTSKCIFNHLLMAEEERGSTASLRSSLKKLSLSHKKRGGGEAHSFPPPPLRTLAQDIFPPPFPPPPYTVGREAVGPMADQSEHVRNFCLVPIAAQRVGTRRASRAPMTTRVGQTLLCYRKTPGLAQEVLLGNLLD